MTEIVRMRERADRARRMLAIDRRKFVTAGIAASTWVACEAGKEIVFDTAKEFVMPEPVVEPFSASDIMALFPKYASPAQKAALSLYQAGEDMAGRLDDLCPDRRYAVIDFSGMRATYRQVGPRLSVIDPGMVGAPVALAPVPEYGRFVYARAFDVWRDKAPSFMSCAGRLPGRADWISYAALMLPAGNKVISIGLPVEMPAGGPAAARRDAPSPALPAPALSI